MRTAGPKDPLAILAAEIHACRRCSRLVEHCQKVAQAKRRAYHEERYWGKPVSSFGDPRARLLLIGLAPGAHGANRTGRIFTGDRSGQFLFQALWETGFANQPTSETRNDGLTLTDAYIAAPVRCAPPENRPTWEEFAACRPFLTRELALLKLVRVVVPLGSLALRAYLSVLKEQALVDGFGSYRFAHGALYRPSPQLPYILPSYHPSQQNTFTGRLTQPMLQAIFLQARTLFRSV